MRILNKNDGIKLLEDRGNYFLEYDSGSHMIKLKRIHITADEAQLCSFDEYEMYYLVLQYQNKDVYGEDV